MDDLQIKMSFLYKLDGTSIVNLEFERIPKIIVNFFLSGKERIPSSFEDFEPMRLFYTNDLEGITGLSHLIEDYIMILDEKKLNEYILLTYLKEILDMFEENHLIISEKKYIKK